jgi:hypothetical protein
MNLRRFNGSNSVEAVLKSLNPYERSEFLRLLYTIETVGFDEPEALVEIENGNEVELISDNKWSIAFNIENKKFNLVIINDISKLHVESIIINN